MSGKQGFYQACAVVSALTTVFMLMACWRHIHFTLSHATYRTVSTECGKPGGIRFYPPENNYNPIPGHSKAVMLDFGARDGDSMEYFLKCDIERNGEPSFDEFYGFEARPDYNNLWKEYESSTANSKPRIIFHQQAVWVKEEVLKFSGDDRSASALMGAQINQISVQAIDIAKWMKSLFRPGDYVAVKMDIEFAEFAVLDHLLETGAIKLIDTLVLECHYDSFVNTDYDKTDKDCVSVCERVVKEIEPHGGTVYFWARRFHRRIQESFSYISHYGIEPNDCNSLIDEGHYVRPSDTWSKI